MAGLVPAIHAFFFAEAQDVDARHKVGHEDGEALRPPHMIANSLFLRSVTSMLPG